MPQLSMESVNEVARLGKPNFRFPKPEDYSWRVRHIRPESLIGYWPLDEVSGTVCHDLSGNARNGSYVGVDLAKTGIGDGRTCPYFDGVNDYVNIYSASLAAAFNGAEGTFLCWIKAVSAADWAAATVGAMTRIAADAASNGIRILNGAANDIEWKYIAGGITVQVIAAATVNKMDWQCLSMTWSKAIDQFRVYARGIQIGTTQTGLGVWTGTPTATRMIVGANTVDPALPLHGNLAHVALWRSALSSQENESLGRVD